MILGVLVGGPKIYTRTGDDGKTRLVDGGCVDKFNPRVEAYGTIDELNSFLGELRGRCREHAGLRDLESALARIQGELFVLGSHFACASDEVRSKLPVLSDEFVLRLENEIDLMEEKLTPLRNFVLPDGVAGARAAHMARTVCRRAERRCAEVGDALAEMERIGLRYLNRLSDYLFVCARFVQMDAGQADVIWKAP